MSAKGLQGARVAAGRASLARLAWALGLERLPAGVRPLAVGWVEDHVELSVGTGPGAELVLQIVERTGGVDGLAAAEALVVRYRGRRVPEWLGRLVQRAAPARLGKTTIGRLAQLLGDDPELGRAGLPLPGRKGEADSESEGGGEGPDRRGDATGDPTDGSRRGGAGPGPGPRFEAGPQSEAGPQREEGPRREEGPPPEKAREATPVPAELVGARRAGGPASREAFARLMGLDGAPEPYAMHAVAWIENRVELAVGGDDEREVVFSLRERGPDSKGLVSTDRLVVGYQSVELPEEIGRRVKRFARSRLAEHDVGSLAALLREDPDFGKPGQNFPPTGHDHPTNQLDTWAGADSFADFFAGGEMARGQLDSINTSKFSRNVQHCDNECLTVNPHGPAPLVSMVDYPWENRARHVGMHPRHLPVRQDRQDMSDSMVASELTEQDVILGNPGKLRQVLEYATSRPNPLKKPIFVANTCVPTVIGEDVESLVREFRRKTDAPLLYLAVTPKSMNDVFKELLVDRRLAKEKETEGVAVEPRSVNLVGFAEGRATAELSAMLEALGVHVNTKLLPDFEVERIDRLVHAPLNVYLPNALWGHLYAQLREGSRLGQLEAPAPYGRAGTLRWAAAVLEGVGAGAGAAQAFEAWAAPLEADWRKAAAGAAGHRLGLVVRGEELHYVLDASQTWGIPLAQFLDEAGFGLDVFLRVRAGKGKELVATLQKALAPGRGHAVHEFTTFAQLRAALAASPCEAVLTHHFYDWRVSEAGKNRFALQHFEPGLAGAVRTVERLVGICETPFYRRYRRWLGRDTAGLRPAPAEILER